MSRSLPSIAAALLMLAACATRQTPPAEPSRELPATDLVDPWANGDLVPKCGGPDNPVPRCGAGPRVPLETEVIPPLPGAPADLLPPSGPEAAAPPPPPAPRFAEAGFQTGDVVECDPQDRKDLAVATRVEAGSTAVLPQQDSILVIRKGNRIEYNKVTNPAGSATCHWIRVDTTAALWAVVPQNLDLQHTFWFASGGHMVGVELNTVIHISTAGVEHAIQIRELPLNNSADTPMTHSTGREPTYVQGVLQKAILRGMAAAARQGAAIPTAVELGDVTDYRPVRQLAKVLNEVLVANADKPTAAADELRQAGIAVRPVDVTHLKRVHIYPLQPSPEQCRAPEAKGHPQCTVTRTLPEPPFTPGF